MKRLSIAERQDTGSDVENPGATAEWRQCTKCGVWKSLLSFGKQNTCKDGRRPDCKSCAAVRGKQWRAANKEKLAKYHKKYQQVHKKEITIRGRKYRQDNKAHIVEYREINKARVSKYQANRQRWNRQAWHTFIGAEDLSCLYCGFNTSFAALDFHHTDPTQKSVSIARMLGRAFTEKNKMCMMKELIKCDVLCRNCHALLHETLKKGVPNA